ncbi:hypothetical protein M2158_004488 [Streptomyces sp. SAI-144]|nr:hypothetical protein [Streptomyces sp. SAI-144]
MPGLPADGPGDLVCMLADLPADGLVRGREDPSFVMGNSFPDTDTDTDTDPDPDTDPDTDTDTDPDPDPDPALGRYARFAELARLASC